VKNLRAVLVLVPVTIFVLSHRQWQVLKRAKKMLMNSCYSVGAFFSYILLNHTTHHYQDFHCNLSDMKYFLNDKGNETVEPSQIHYMELINENPDRDETICIVAEDLLEKFEQD